MKSLQGYKFLIESQEKLKEIPAPKDHTGVTKIALDVYRERNDSQDIHPECRLKGHYWPVGLLFWGEYLQSILRCGHMSTTIWALVTQQPSFIDVSAGSR